MKNRNNDSVALVAVAAVTLALVGGGVAVQNNNPSTSQTSNYDRPIFKGQTDFIKKVYPYALQAQRMYPKVPVSLIIAQAGLESGWGKAAVGNNFFGVKAGKSWKGERQLITTTEILPRPSGYNFPEIISVTPTANGKYRYKVKDWFRKYPSPLYSFLDYCKLITSGRYADNYSKGDVYSIIEEIKKDGYATDPNYVPKLKKLVDLVDKVIREAA